MSTVKLTDNVQQRNNNMRSKTHNKTNAYKIASTAMFAALASVLMFFEIPVPLMPPFIKFDVSELPALMAAFVMGPVSGVFVCLVKNLVNVIFSQSFGVGEVCNFLLGVAFVLPAGLIYRRKQTFVGAMVGAIVGCFSIAILSLPINYFIVYPAYFLAMPKETILEAYQLINPKVDTIFECLLIFNLPFTFIKGLCNVILCFMFYKPLMSMMKAINR